MGKNKKSPIIVLAVALVALYAVIYILPKVSGVLQLTYTAEYGELEVGDTTTGYLVRNEYVYFTEKTGEENRYIKENTLVRRGTRIMEVVSKEDREAAEEEVASDKTGKSGREDDKKEKQEGKKETENAEATEAAGTEEKAGESDTEKASNETGLGTYQRFRANIKGKNRIASEDFIAEQEGLVSYHIDGFESMLTPKNMGKKKKSFLQKLSNNDTIDLRRDTVLDTDPVFKICDRSKWYIICYVKKQSGDRYKPGDKVSIRVEDKWDITGKVMSAIDERREKRLTIKSDNYFSDLTRIRKAEMELIKENVMGLIISNSSIVERKNKKGKTEKGVYVKRKTGSYDFVPVNVLATDGKESAITATRFRDKEGNSIDTVRSYDDVLRRPSKDMK